MICRFNANEFTKKKIIAREFILLLFCIIISLMAYGSIHIHNFIKNNNNTTKLNQQLKIKQSELDSLREASQVHLDEFEIPINKNGLSKTQKLIEEDSFKAFGGQLLPTPPSKKSSLPSDLMTIHEFLLINDLTSKDKLSFYEEYKDIIKQRKLYRFMVNNNLTTKDFEKFSRDNFQQSDVEPNKVSQALKSIYNDLNFEKRGMDFNSFKSSFINYKVFRKFVYKDLGLELAGIKYYEFEEKLGLRKPNEVDVRKTNSLQKKLTLFGF